MREWLNAQAAGGYVTYDAATRQLHAAARAGARARRRDEPGVRARALPGHRRRCGAASRRSTSNFRTGEGLEWGDQHPCLFEGTERFFRSGYIGNLVQRVAPGARRRRGQARARRQGRRRRLRARRVDDPHGEGVSRSRRSSASTTTPDRSSSRASARKEAGVADRVTFEVATPTEFPGNGYDLVAHFDCLHDMGDPVGAARRARGRRSPPTARG